MSAIAGHSEFLDVMPTGVLTEARPHNQSASVPWYIWTGVVAVCCSTWSERWLYTDAHTIRARRHRSG